MAGLKIEGNLDNVSEPQLGYIKSVLEKHGLDATEVVFETVGKAGDNYAANVKRIVIEDKNGDIIKMIAKIAPTFETLRVLANTELLFKNEHVMYTKVLPKFEQLQKVDGKKMEKVDVPAENRLRFARLYGSFEAAPNEVILLEDLKESGFEMLDRFRSLSDECVRSVLKNLATLHSLSYALKNKEPEVFEEFKNILSDLWLQVLTQDESKQYFNQLESNALMVLESDIHKKAIKGIMAETMNAMLTLSKLNKDSRYAIIQQGDPWTNNIMFKIDEENQPQSVMIDYQISKVTSPACDLHYMIFNCTDYETRKAHYLDWIDYYHDQLDKNLSLFGLKANFVYPRDQLDADLKRHGKMSLGIGVLLGNVLVRKTEEAAQLKEAMESADLDEIMKQSSTDTLDPESIALFKAKIEGMIDTHLELGYI